MDNTIAINIPFPIRRCPALKGRISLKTFWLLFFLLAVSLLVIYIFQVNQLVKNAYLIPSHQKKLNGLSQENKELEINFSKVNSLASLTESIKKLNLEKAGQIHYIQVLEAQVVAK